MLREVKGRFVHGKIEPLEDLELSEGAEVTILVREDSDPEDNSEALEAFERSAGSWEGTLDFDEFIRDIHEGRKRRQLPSVDL